MTKDEILSALARPFEEKQISWRVGSTNQDKTSGIALAYIDARDVMRRLDNIFGLDWQCRYTHADQKTICEIGVKIDGEWIWRAGGAGDSDIEAEKGAISDAFKRAAVLFRIGQYLYELPNQWVNLISSGKSYKLAGNPTLPRWATPEGYDEIMARRSQKKEIEEKQKNERLPKLTDEDAEKEYNAWIEEKCAFIDKDGVADVEAINTAWFKKPSNVRTAIDRYGDGLIKSDLDKQAQQHLNSINNGD